MSNKILIIVIIILIILIAGYILFTNLETKDENSNLSKEVKKELDKHEKCLNEAVDKGLEGKAYYEECMK